MKILSIIVLICGILAVAYAATEPLDLEAEPSTEVHTRDKRGLLLAKAALLGGGALLAKKALVVGGAGLVGAGLVGAGIAGAGLYKAKAYGHGGYYGGYRGYNSGWGGYRSYQPVYYSSGYGW